MNNKGMHIKIRRLEREIEEIQRQINVEDNPKKRVYLLRQVSDRNRIIAELKERMPANEN